MRKWFRLVTRGLVLTAAAAIIALGISCEKGLLTNNDYTTGSSATKDVAGSSKDELSLLMHQQAQTLPAPTPSGVGLTSQKSIITTSAVNPDLPFTVVPLDEFGRYTDTIKANIDDVVYIELQGVLTGYYNGAILVKATGADIISIEESYDYWWNGIGLWWTPASADTTKGGAGTLYNYKHIHSPVSDTYKSEGSSWCAAWEAEANQYGYPYGPAGSLVTGTIISPISEARFYFSGYLGNHSATRPGLRLGLRLKDSSAVGINITGHNRYEFSWLNLSSVYSGTITATPRGNYQSVHSEGENCWAQVSGPISATVGDTIAVTTYGELMMDAGQYRAVVERIDDGITATLTSTGVAVGNEFGPIEFPVTITSASPHGIICVLTSLGTHLGLSSSTLWYSVSRKDTTSPEITITTQPQLNVYDCTSANPLAATITAEDIINTAKGDDWASGVKEFKYEIFKDGASQGVTNISPPTTSTDITPLTATGRYQIKIWAIDNVNLRTDKTQNIIIDRSPSTVEAGSISPGNITGTAYATNQTTITVTKPVSDAISGVLKVEVKIQHDTTGISTTQSISPVTTSPALIPVTLPAGITDGRLTISTRVWDKAGNSSWGDDTYVLLDRVLPTITATYNKQPNVGVWYNVTTTGAIIVTVTATDLPFSSGILVPTPNPLILTFPEKNRVFSQTYSAMDYAGNISTLSVRVDVNIDKDPPGVPNGNVTLTTTNNANLSYAQVEAKLKAMVTNTTGGSALEQGNIICTGIPAGGIVYGGGWSPGDITITATDNAGNVTTKTVKVRVRN